MGAGVKPEIQNEEDPLSAYRQQRDAVDPLTAYRQSKSGGSIVLPPGDTTPDVAEPPKPLRLRPVVVTKREELPKPPAPAASDATRVGPEPVGLAGRLQSHAPGQSGNFANDVAESAMEMVTHPVETAKSLAETPFKGGQALGEYVAGRGSKKAAIAGTAQTAAMLLGGPAEKLGEPAVARLVGEAAAPAVTRTALGAATGAVFTPDRPAIGATLGGLAGAASSRGVAAAKLAERQAKLDAFAKQYPEWFGDYTPADVETRQSRLLANPNAATASARVAEEPAPSAEPDFTIEEPNAAPSPIEVKGVFGGALEQHGKDYAAGKVPAGDMSTKPAENVNSNVNFAPLPSELPTTVEATDAAIEQNATRYNASTDPAERRAILKLHDILEEHRAALAPPEKEETKHDYASTQLDLPEETASAIKQLGESIPDEHLADDGREDKPHVTVKYGLHGDDPEAVRALLADEPPITVKLGKTSFFPNGESDSGDVLKVDVESSALRRLNKKIADALPHTDTHPTYKPHATVAYLKPGLGKKYSGNESLAGHTVTLDRVTFSDKNGNKTEIPLGGKPPKAKNGKGPFTVEAYRGTGRVARPTENGFGRFYSPNKEVAAEYGEPKRESLKFDKPLRAENWMEAKKDLTLDPSATMDDVLKAAAKSGFDGIVFANHNGAPEYVDLHEPPAPVHESARLPSGGLRDNLETVKTDGLIREMFKLLGAEDQRDAQRAIYRTVEADVSGTQYGVMVQAATRHGNGPSEQAKALHRIELKKGVAGRIERVLNDRGLSDKEITHRYAELLDIEAERSAELEGMDNEDSGDTSFDFPKEGYTNEHGEGAGRAAAAEGAHAPAERSASRSAGDVGPGEGEGPPPAQAKSNGVDGRRAELYHELHTADTPEARAEILDRIKALDSDVMSPMRAEPDDQGASDEIREAERRMRDALHKTKNGYEQAVHDLWEEQGTHGRLALLDNWRRLYPEQDWFPEWADRSAEDLPAHVRDKIGMERVNQAVALKDIMSRLRTGESSVGAQFDKSLFKKLGANLYKGDIPSVIVKEGIQNAFDSIRPLGDKGRIHVEIDPAERTITISDNGHGMTPEVASNEFMDVGGSSKLEGSSGGFGLAKVGLLASAEHFSLVTIAEVKEKSKLLGREKTKRIITTIAGSADDWIHGTLKFASEELKDDTQGTGTRLSVTIEKSLEPQFYNAQSLLQTVMNTHHEQYQLTGTIRRKNYVPGYKDRPSTTSVEDNPVVATSRLELNREAVIKEKVPGAEIEATPTKELMDNAGPFDSATEIHILNNGLYQFGSYKSLGTGAPRQLLVNIKPTVPVDHPDYPFTTSREDLKGKVVEALTKIYKDMAAAAGATEIRDLIRALKAGIPIGSSGKTALFDTTYATPRSTLEELGKKPYVSEMADRISDMMSVISKAIGSRLTFPDYHFGGLSTAHGYLGVNISRSVIAEKARAFNIGYEGDKSNVILLNPWMMFDEVSTVAGTPRSPQQLLTDDEYAPVLAEQTYGTIVHEIAHQLARGHGEDFAGTQTRFDAVAVRVAHVALDVLEEMWRSALKGGLRDDVNNLRVEAWGRGKPDAFKKFSGHLRAGTPEGDSGGIPGGSDAAAAYLRPSEADGGVGEGDAERRGLGARARGSVRGSAARSETAGDAGSRTPGPVPRNGRKPESAVDGSEPDPTAVATAAAGRFDKAVDDVKKMFAPASRGPLARETANITREQVARMAHENEIARDRLAGFAKAFDKMPREDRLEFIDAMENPRPQATEQLSDAADAIRDMLDSARDAVRRLGTGHLENFIENYFPHIWSDPDEAARVINQITGKRPLEGTRSFLKRRTIPTIKEGMELGLEPISTNPVDLSLLKIREMNRYIMGQRVLGEMKRAQLAKFVNAFEKAPDGYARINDHVAMVYGPPTVPVGEAFDALVRKQLVDVIKSLGVEHTRPIKIKGLRSAGGGTVWGVAEGDRRIQAKFGGDATIIMHELGHILDHRYGLWHKLVERVAKRPNTKAKLEKNRGKLVPDQKHPSNSEAAKKRRVTIKKELRALADLRYEGENPDNVASTYKDYVRERPEQVANAVHAYIYAKAKMQRVAPTVYDVLDGIIKGDPKLAPLANVEPSVKLGSGSNETPVGGLVVKGQYWAPEAAASIINNYLSPGLRGNAVFDSYMGLGNFMNGAQLGFSAFHLGFTSMEAAVSRVALSLRQLAAGKPGKALRSFATAPAAPITNYMRGRQLYNAYLHPDRSNADMTQIVDALVSGGGRIRMDNFYKSGAIEGLKKALEEHNPWGVAWRAYPAFIELAVKPILEHVVPRQKMGVFSDLARLEIEKLGQNPDPKDVRAAMAKIWDSVDNRMGQLVYDNLFWNKVGKDLAMASVRAVGWNLGTLREIGGGLAEIPSSYKRWKEGDEILTTKLSYILALPIFVGMMGAIYNYLATGEAPKELKDYFYPRTGALGPDGNPERVQLPSYMKDVWAYAHHPVNTIESKLHPTIETLSEMLHNKDFYGTMIVDPDAPLDEKVKEYGKFLSRSIQPFALRNALVARGRGQSLATQAQSFVGVTAAPREVVRTPAQNRMADLLSRHAPSSRTPEESDKGELHRTVTDAVRKGEQLPESVNAALDDGKLKRGTLMTWIHDARLPSTVQQFKKLTLDEAELVYGLASDDEKALWANAYRTKVVNGQR